MNEKVSKLIEQAKQQEKAIREEHLISLGLVNENKTVRVYSDYSSNLYDKWDEEAKQYYYEAPAALDVTDEEYAEILKYYPVDNKVNKINNGAEKFLEGTIAFILVLGILASFFLLIFAFAEGINISITLPITLIISLLVYWAVIRVFLNISNNLHEINKKLK